MKALSLVLPAITTLAFLVILGPILTVVVVSFTSADFFTFPPPGFSLRWFGEFFALENMRNAFALSIVMAIAAATIASAIALAGAIWVTRNYGLLSSFLQALFMAPLVFPTIILGVALLIFYKSIAMPTLPGLMLGHILVATPYCFRVVLISLQSFDRTQEEAGASLGAGPFRTFLLVTLPQIWTGVMAGWFFGFIESFGEINVSLFLSGPGLTTLPVEIFSYLQFQGSQLVIAAASTLQIGIILAMLIVLERVIGVNRMTRS
jgi:putative spermidine/putrescine transport system permease protein